MLSSLLQFGLLAAGLAAALALFLSLKQELRTHTQKSRADLDEILRHLQNGQHPAPEPPAQALTPVPLRSGINLSKRTQALRLLRRGEDVSHVAAALGVSRREIELLLRVQKLTVQRAAGAGKWRLNFED